MTTNFLDSKEHAQQVHEILRRATHEAYFARIKNGNIDVAEAERTTRSALRMVITEAKVKFGDNRAHPDCDYCLEVSVFGGPSHENSRLCRSGKRPHCTCDACF